MKWFLNRSTRGKLTLCFGLMILFLIVVVGLAYQTVRTIQESQGKLLDVDFANAFDFNTFDSIINGERADLLSIYVLTDPAEKEAAQRSLKEYARQADELMPRLLERNERDATLSRNLQELVSLRRAFLDLRDNRILPFVVQGKGEDTNKLQSEQNERFKKMRAMNGEMLKKTEQSARASVAESGRAADRSVLIFVIVSIVALLTNVVIVVSLNQILANPLNRVSDMARQIADGNLKGDKLAVGSSDEIGQLMQAFNVMLESLRNLANQIRGVTENINSAAGEILASTQQQASSTREQSATVHEITSTMQEISQSGAQIADRARQVAGAVEATSSASTAGIQAVADTNRTMETIREQVEEVAENIVALSEKTQAVGEIVATVNDIAEQSNLLALNATIEAAAAGEQGNRFSVVANEMKNLADQAKQCTVQVRTLLGDIRKGINTSVMLTEEAVKRVESGKTQADVTERTIRDMTQTTQESVQAFQQIIAATNQQQIGLDQVTQGMQDIRQAAEQTASGTAQLEKAVTNLNDLSQQLRQAVRRYQL